jgi:hypothetical protein
VSSTEGGAGNGDTQSLAVFGLPTVSVTTPRENAVYSFEQKVIARYTCQDAFGAPGLSACSGDADNGTAIAPLFGKAGRTYTSALKIKP